MGNLRLKEMGEWESWRMRKRECERGECKIT